MPLFSDDGSAAVKYAGVHLPELPFALDREFDYLVPPDLENEVRPGCFVGVPFGNGDRLHVGLVTRVSDVPGPDGDGGKSRTYKKIAAACPDEITLDGQMLELMDYLRTYTLCTVGEAVKTMIPQAAMSSPEEIYIPGPGNVPGGALAAEIYRYVVSRGRVSVHALTAKFGRNTGPKLRELESCGALRRILGLRERRKKERHTVSLAVPAEEAEAVIAGQPVLSGGARRRITSAGQLSVLKELVSSGREMLAEELTSLPGVTSANIASLRDKGLVRTETENVDRDSLLIESRKYSDGGKQDFGLSPEQSEAYGTLHALAFSGEPKAALLEGVTGSGKTCVMLKLIDDVLAAGKGVILLLPEIALTPQSLSIFCSRYGDCVAVMHSGLSEGERADAYMRMKRGDARLCIGTRSAVFAPVKDLGLIVIDEEQEHTYKSDSSPRYHARDIARVRCAQNRALMFLASATPSLESRKKAEDGAYTLIRLNKRYGNSVLPKVTVADMRLEAVTGNVTPIGRLLAQRMKETYERGEQSVLFLNRRGYNNFLSCASCGEALKCPNCSVSLTFHVKKGSYTEGSLVCHWCGYRSAVPAQCPSCGSEHILRMGYGTQRVEEEIGKLLPGARVLRMDADSTAGRDAYDSMLGAFRRHEADVLLGTQMVTKGHDFPDVTLVGVLLADASLYYDDYRASERTFALLTQVIGRAGRRDRPGEAVIQTNNPNHEIIALAGRQDYETMYSREIKLRRALLFPPFCDIALLTMTSEDERSLMTFSAAVKEKLREGHSQEGRRDLPMVVFGPFEAPVYRVDGRYRMRIIVKCRLSKTTRTEFAELLRAFPHGDRTAPVLTVDFNPTSL